MSDPRYLKYKQPTAEQLQLLKDLQAHVVDRAHRAVTPIIDLVLDEFGNSGSNALALRLAAFFIAGAALTMRQIENRTDTIVPVDNDDILFIGLLASISEMKNMKDTDFVFAHDWFEKIRGYPAKNLPLAMTREVMASRDLSEDVVNATH